MRQTFYSQKYLYLDPPIAYSVHLSVEMLLVTIVGGMGTVFGPLIGSLVLHTVNEVTRNFIDAPGLSLIVYGIILIIIISYLPNGLIGLFSGRGSKKGDAAPETAMLDVRKQQSGLVVLSRYRRSIFMSTRARSCR